MNVKFMTMNPDRLFKPLCYVCAGLCGALTVGFLIQLAISAWPTWQAFGWRFLFNSEWDAVEGVFGASTAIVGTLITTGIALVVALPLAFCAALFLTSARPWIAAILSQAVDLLAAIPSVIYGMWGLFVFAPIMQELFPDSTGFGLFTAGLILGLMILPYICAVMREVVKMTPTVLREAAFGAGCTAWEVARDIVMRYGLRGLLGGIFIGLGRALGETMAVLFVIGNMMEMPENLFSGATTIASTLANNFGEATGLERSSLFALGFILLMMEILIQVIAQYYLHSTGRNRGETR